MPTVDESSHSAAGMLNRLRSATFFLYTLHCPFLPLSRKKISPLSLLDLHPHHYKSDPPAQLTHHPNDIIRRTLTELLRLFLYHKLIQPGLQLLQSSASSVLGHISS